MPIAALFKRCVKTVQPLLVNRGKTEQYKQKLKAFTQGAHDRKKGQYCKGSSLICQ
jgi:hypothetical protein